MHLPLAQENAPRFSPGYLRACEKPLEPQNSMSNAKGQVSNIKHCLFFAHPHTYTHTHLRTHTHKSRPCLVLPVWDIFMHMCGRMCRRRRDACDFDSHWFSIALALSGHKVKTVDSTRLESCVGFYGTIALVYAHINKSQEFQLNLIEMFAIPYGIKVRLADTLVETSIK